MKTIEEATKMIESKKAIKSSQIFICPACAQENHIWHEAYYQEGVKLLKANKSYITWCNTYREYVITNTI
jgi:hypothetical protein